MKGQRGFVLMAKRPFAGLFHKIARWQVVHAERQMLCEAVGDMALKETGGKKREENGQARKDGL